MTGGDNQTLTNEQAVHLVNQGWTRKAIAEHYGVSTMTVYRRLREVGQTRTWDEWTSKKAPTPQQAADLRGQGWSVRAISSEYDVSYKLVADRLAEYDQQHGTSYAPKRKASGSLTPEQAREAYEDHGLTERQVAELHEVSISKAQMALDRAGVERRSIEKPVDTEYLRRLYEDEDLSALAISRRPEVDLSHAQVLNRLRKVGVNTEYTPQDDPLLLVHLAYHRGLPAMEIARDARVQSGWRHVYRAIPSAVDKLGGIPDQEDCGYCQG